MAENTTTEVLKVKVDGVEKAVTNIKELKLATKQAKDEQLDAALKYGESSKQYLEASKRVSALKDKVEDLADSTNALKGSGLERATQGVQQFGEGIKNLDFDKVKVGLTAMKTALGALGIGLIIQAVTYLVENFKELSEGSGVLATFLRGVADAFSAVKNFVTDLIGLTSEHSRAIEAQGEALAKSAEQSTEALQKQTHEYDNQIAAAKAAGKSTIELEKQKQEAIIATNMALLKQALDYIKAGGEIDEAKSKLINSQIQALQDARNQLKIIDINDKKEAVERHKKHMDDLDKQYRALQEKWKSEKDAAVAEELAQKAAELEIARLDAEAKAQVIIDVEAAKNAELLNQSAQKAEAELAIDEEKHQKQRQMEQYSAKLAFDGYAMSLKSAQQLSDFLFDLKMRKLKKGSEEELKAAKRQFQINKALAIQTSIITGIQGVINALSAQSVIPEPYGTILKVITAVGVGIAATVNTAKIAATQFNAEGGGGGGGGGSADLSAGGSATAGPPTINTPQNTQATNPNTTFGEDGKNQSIKVKAEVVETESRSTTNRVNKIENQSTF